MKQGLRRHAEPDWALVHRELRRKHVTLSILWEEYIAQHPAGYRYSRFCDLYRGWEGKLSLTMRQSHAGGEKLFVDYAGDTVPVIVDRLTGEVREAQIFVAVLGASSFSYAQASWMQGLADWIAAHIGALEAIGGVPRLLVPDNAKVAVVKACLYDPEVNRSYAEMAAHYGMAVLPARPKKPRDKAKVEAAVLIVERWLIGRLRYRRFHGLGELNQAIRELLYHLNERRPIRRLGVTRRQLIEELDRPHLKPLPAEPYVFAEWRVRRVGIDYHVDIDRHFYSVPCRFARREVEVRLTARTVEIFCKGERIAAHLRMSSNGRHTTIPEHMPSSHRRYANWTIERILREAAAIGILRLTKPFGAARVAAAASRALEIGARTYGSVKSILDNNLDRHAQPRRAGSDEAILHPTSAARATTTEETPDAPSSHPRPAQPPGPLRHGQGLHRDRGRGRARQHDPCRVARPAARPRGHSSLRQEAGAAAALCPSRRRRGRRLPQPPRPRPRPPPRVARCDVSC
jgi:transposase